MAVAAHSIPAPGGTYGLPRDKVESARLDTQHRVYADNTGYLLHPRLAAVLPEDAHIADVATGTGIWLTELSCASTTPITWHLTGLDISTEQFPPSDARGRCKFDTINILDPVPDKYKSKFDVVHVRLLILGLRGSDWTTAASNICKLLKPGGFVQWQESDVNKTEVLQNITGASTCHLSNLAQRTLRAIQANGQFMSDVVTLRATLEASGFQGCTEDIFSSDRVAETRSAATQIGLVSMNTIADMVIKGGGGPAGWTRATWKALMKKAGEEVEGDKIYVRWVMHVVTGQKPLEI